jgi:hypothetical protein
MIASDLVTGNSEAPLTRPSPSRARAKAGNLKALDFKEYLYPLPEGED